MVYCITYTVAMFTCYKANGDILLIFESIHRQRVVNLFDFDPVLWEWFFSMSVALSTRVSSFEITFLWLGEKYFRLGVKFFLAQK